MTAFEQITLELDLSPPDPVPKPEKKILKACPFCGQPVNVLIGGNIHCGRCRALIIIAGTKDDIINTWNTRRTGKHGRRHQKL